MVKSGLNSEVVLFSSDFNSGILLHVAKPWFYIGSINLQTKTCLYNFDPLKPHFYIVKLGFAGVYIIFLISVQKHRLCMDTR